MSRRDFKTPVLGTDPLAAKESSQKKDCILVEANLAAIGCFSAGGDGLARRMAESSICAK